MSKVNVISLAGKYGKKKKNCRLNLLIVKLYKFQTGPNSQLKRKQLRRKSRQGQPNNSSMSDETLLLAGADSFLASIHALKKTSALQTLFSFPLPVY